MAAEVDNKCAPLVELNSSSEPSPKPIKQEEESISVASGDGSSVFSVDLSTVCDEVNSIRKKRKRKIKTEKSDFDRKNEQILNENDDLSPIECPICSKPMQDRFYLEVHLACHAGERQFSCSFCFKSFQSKSNLIRHEKVHQGDEMDKIDSDDALSVDASSSAGDAGVQCPICSKFVRDRYYMVVHLRTHTGEKPFCCSYCDKAFNSRSNLLRHEKLHLKSGGIRCSYCSNWFENDEELNLHLAAKHKLFGGKNLKKIFSKNCLKCKKLFYLSQQQTHQQHQSQQFCPSCARQSSKKPSSASAPKTASNDGSAPPCHSSTANSNVVLFQPTYFCGICLESLDSRKLLLSHLKDAHSSFKPYICDVCSDKFNDYSHYKEHERRHLVENDSASCHSSADGSSAQVGLPVNGNS